MHFEMLGRLGQGPGLPQSGQDHLRPKPPVEVHLRHPVQYHDVESGLFQNWNRQYNAKIGRNVEFDPIGLRGGINGYLYVDGDPLRGTDPKGLANSAASSWMRGKSPVNQPEPSKKPLLKPKSKCVLMCQAALYPVCAATAYGMGLSFGAISTPAGGVAAGAATSAACNAIAMHSYCVQRCEQSMQPQACPVPELPPIDPNAENGQVVDLTY